MYNFILAMAFGSCLFLMLCNSNMFAVMYIYHLTPAIPLLRLKSSSTNRAQCATEESRCNQSRTAVNSSSPQNL